MLAALCLAALGVQQAAAQTPACQVTYTQTWVGGNGFGADIRITNNGPAITNGWTLLFNFPNGQRLQNGWPVSFTQPAGSSQVTVASNADWNRSIGSGQSFTAGFNGTFSGANNPPAQFTLNGTVCNGGTTSNTPPSVSLTSPASGQQFASGAAVTLAANASDNGAISRVEFRIDGALVSTDTSAPYSFSTSSLAAGSHTAQATAFDNATPPLSTSTVTIPFTVLAPTNGGSLLANPATLNLSGGATGTVNYRLSAAPSGNVSVTLTRAGSTVITSSPGNFTLSGSNWSTGVNVTYTAAAGTTAATSTFAAAAANYTGVTVTVNRTASTNTGRADNPYSGAGVYNNPIWRQNAVNGGGSAIANQPTAVWMDRISAIAGNNSGSTGAWGLVQHLNEAVSQDAANGSTPLVFQLVIYNLPGRDCAALASNGELGPNDLPRYKAEYIDVIAGILRRAEYANLRVVTVIEIDSLPNLRASSTTA
jgi:cellulose 1,4-beta-cellobiosidase